MEKVTVSENGIPIYYYPNEQLHSFCLSLYIKAGSMYEPDDRNGATHLWEHMVFRKLNKLYNNRFYQILDILGLSFSACTYREFVQLQITGAPEHFRESAKIMGFVFEPMNLTGKELELEKRRIKSEIRENDEEHSLEYFSKKLVWENTPLANTISGKNKVIDKIGVNVLQQIQTEICSSGNLFFYITGCFKKEDVAFLSNCIAPYELASGELHTNSAPVPKRMFQRDAQIEIKNSKYNCVFFSFDIDVTRYSYAELNVIYDILFSGENSKVYQQLSEQSGYIYSFDARLERYSNVGSLSFTFEVQKKNILPSIEKVVRILSELKTAVTDELLYVLPTYVDNAEFILDSDEELNWNRAYECHIMGNSHQSVQEEKQQYQKITPERIQTIAGEIFTRNNMILTLKTEKKTFPVEEASKLIRRL